MKGGYTWIFHVILMALLMGSTKIFRSENSGVNVEVEDLFGNKTKVFTRYSINDLSKLVDELKKQILNILKEKLFLVSLIEMEKDFG